MEPYFCVTSKEDQKLAEDEFDKRRKAGEASTGLPCGAFSIATPTLFSSVAGGELRMKFCFFDDWDIDDVQHPANVHSINIHFGRAEWAAFKAYGDAIFAEAEEG